MKDCSKEFEASLKENNTIPKGSKCIMCIVEENPYYVSKREALNIIANLATQVNMVELDDRSQD